MFSYDTRKQTIILARLATLSLLTRDRVHVRSYVQSRIVFLRVKNQCLRLHVHVRELFVAYAVQLHVHARLL